MSCDALLHLSGVLISVASGLIVFSAVGGVLILVYPWWKP